MARRSCTLLLMIVLLCACERSTGSERITFLTPTPPATQTERIVVWTSTPVYTYTPIVLEVTSTPNPEYLCVTADEAVHLRPSPSVDNYPIAPLPNGTRLLDLGGKKEEWIFVKYDELSGWVHEEYVGSCK